MATEVYETGYVELIDGTLIYLTPLKIRYLRDFMVYFQSIHDAKNDEESIDILSQCVVISMQQYYPEIATKEILEDKMDLPGIYSVLKIAAGIDINENKETAVKDQAEESGAKWEDLDLAKLEAEAFLLGIWKDYEELETSMSMPELIATLNVKRDLDYQEKKFLAAIQGVDIDKESGEKNAWEEMKARVYSKGKASNANDILAFQGNNASKAGFGIGMGLGYENLGKK